MREANRAYDILRAFIGREFDRIQSLDLVNAKRELEESMNPGGTTTQSPTSAPKATSEAGPVQVQILIPEGQSREQVARTILGVPESASFHEIRKSYERLTRRSQPGNFQAGTPEANQATEILGKVQWAYGVLTDTTTRTEKRFGSLEIE